jgi:uncharacterized membrane protein YkoI
MMSCMKYLAFSLALALAGPALANAAPAAFKGAALLPQAKVSLSQARATALKREHGIIVDQELEKEAGGSGLRYTFDIKVGKVVREVGVDAATGKILEDIVDTGND